jgi:hypothetical protein
MDTKNLLLTAAMTGIMLGGSALASDSGKTTTDTVHCQGVNSCKATGDCGGKTHGCAGSNECKGKGWKKMSQKDCDVATAALKLKNEKATKEKATKEMPADKKS